MAATLTQTSNRLQHTPGDAWSGPPPVSLSSSAAYARASRVETVCPTALGAAAERLCAARREQVAINRSLVALGNVLVSGGVPAPPLLRFLGTAAQPPRRV